MARISVLQHDQSPYDHPAETMRLSEGKTLVRKCRAEWIRRNSLLRLFPEGTFKLSRPLKTPGEQLRRFLSVNPTEVAGLKFEDPASAPPGHSRSRATLIGMANRLYLSNGIAPEMSPCDR